jgi:hypothetical protein
MQNQIELGGDHKGSITAPAPPKIRKRQKCAATGSATGKRTFQQGDAYDLIAALPKNSDVLSSDWAVHFIEPDGKTRIGPWLLHESHDEVLTSLIWGNPTEDEIKD